MQNIFLLAVALPLLASAASPPKAALVFSQGQVTGACQCTASFHPRSLNGFTALFTVTKESADDACSNGSWISGFGDPPGPPILIAGCQQDNEEARCKLSGSVAVTLAGDAWYEHSEVVNVQLPCADFTIREIRDGSNILVASYAFKCTNCEAD